MIDVTRKLVDAIGASGHVRRFHAKTILRDNTVGEHTYGVLWWLRIIVPDEELTKQLLFAALQHDMPEYVTGDIPAPTKRACGSAFDKLEESVLVELGVPPAALTPEEETWLKLADIIDGMAFCVRERELGNSTLRTTFVNYRAYFSAYTEGVLLSLASARAVVKILEERFYDGSK